MRNLRIQRKELARGRERLGISQRDAAKLTNRAHKTIDFWEMGVGRGYSSTLAGIRALCREYMRIAGELGYDPLQWHESALCPGEFPSPLQEQSL